MESHLALRSQKRAEKPQFEFKLFIAGDKARDRFTAQSLQKLCEQFLHANYVLTVVDVVQHPNIAQQERVLATPTLVRLSPKPTQRIIGDLSARDCLFAECGFTEVS